VNKEDERAANRAGETEP